MASVDTIAVLRSVLTASDSSGISSALSAGVDATDLSFTVTDASEFTIYDLRVYKVGAELVYGTCDGVAITVEAGGRGAFGTTAASHALGATVKEATFYDVCPTRIGSQPFADNDSPSAWIDVITEGVLGDSPAMMADVDLYFYGGTGNKPYAGDARLLARLCRERLDNLRNENTPYGRLICAYHTDGESIEWDDSVPWPHVIAGYAVNVINRA